MSSNRSRVTSAGSLYRWIDVPRDLGDRYDCYAALEDRPLAVNDRHVGQRQPEDDCKERRNEPNSVVMSTSS